MGLTYGNSTYPCRIGTYHHGQGAQDTSGTNGISLHECFLCIDNAQGIIRNVSFPNGIETIEDCESLLCFQSTTPTNTPTPTPTPTPTQGLTNVFEGCSTGKKYILLTVPTQMYDPSTDSPIYREIGKTFSTDIGHYNFDSEDLCITAVDQSEEGAFYVGSVSSDEISFIGYNNCESFICTYVAPEVPTCKSTVYKRYIIQ